VLLKVILQSGLGFHNQTADGTRLRFLWLREMLDVVFGKEMMLEMICSSKGDPTFRLRTTIFLVDSKPPSLSNLIFFRLICILVLQVQMQNVDMCLQMFQLQKL
jgi:hypothetical protein